MAGRPITFFPVVGTPPASNPQFPSMYYDSPETQLVLAFNVTATTDNLTPSIQSGSQFFQIGTVQVHNWVRIPIEPPPIPPVNGGGKDPEIVIPRGPLTLSEPVATWDGKTPLPVKLNQCVLVYVSAEVPKGDLSAPGAFNGVLDINGSSITESAALSGTYLGTLMGGVTASPASVLPGQSTTIQINDANGKALSDTSVTIIVQGIECSSIYYTQFPNPGDRTLYITASRGALVESTSVTISVVGNPVLFRTSLEPGAVKEIPMLQVVTAGDPYTANFRIGNNAASSRFLAKLQEPPLRELPTPSIPPNVLQPGSLKPATVEPETFKPEIVQPDTVEPDTIQPDIIPIHLTGMDTEFQQIVKRLRPDQVRQITPTHTIATLPTATSTASLTLIPVGGFRTPLTATSYEWNFGDGSTLITQAPEATHSYFSAIQPNKVVHNFVVTVRIVQDSITINRSLAITSPYGISRLGGFVVPHILSSLYATFQNVTFQSTLVAYNLENEALTLNRVAYVPFSDNSSVALPAPVFVSMDSLINIPARGSAGLGILVVPSQLQLPNVVTNGFTAMFAGQTVSGVPVVFTRAFRIPYSDSGIPRFTIPIVFNPGHWDLAAALRTVTQVTTLPGGALSPVGGQAIDKTTNIISVTFAPGTSTQAAQDTLQSAVSAAVTGIALQTGALSLDRPGRRIPLGSVRQPFGLGLKPEGVPQGIQPQFDPLNPLTPAPGIECYPDDISDANQATADAQQLVCQATSQTEYILLPSAFQNAQAGDIILSPAMPADGDMIATMFRALTPPQYHGHSGIMTSNFLEITHCTAVVNRITNNTNNTAGIPTSLVGNIMQYGWPGSITQSVDDAIAGVNIYDPNGTPYFCSGFNADSEGDSFSLTYPLVVKPNPANEGQVRASLRKVADLARSKGAQYVGGKQVVKGGCYYSFYCYTNPQISIGFNNPAGSDALWATGLVPAVCSSFIWLCAKETGIPLVTNDQFEKLSDFTQGAIQQGANVDAETLDGLILYPEADRLQGAESLYQSVLNQALDKVPGLGDIPGINSVFAGPIADQLLNDFAFNNPNLVNNSQWKNPGVGRAVSPDNIRWWNAPYYGFTENLQYLQSQYEQYTISQWVKVVTWGTITGNVTYNGQPVPNCHVWWSLPSGDTYTDANGNYSFDKVPIGSYVLKAQAVLTTNGISVMHTNGAGQPITLTAADSSISQNMQLQDNPTTYRDISLQYQISCNHSDGNPFHTHGAQTGGPWTRGTFVNASQPTSGLGYTFDYSGGGYFSIAYSFSFGLLTDLSITCTMTGSITNAGDSSPIDQYAMGPFLIPAGQTISGTMNLAYSQVGYTDGPSTLTFSITNSQATG